MLVVGLAVGIGVVSTGSATASSTRQAVVQDSPFEALNTPVGLTAVGLGVIGMVAGVFRRKKIEVQPENQRKS
ncbi:hypothetical protein GCM10027563_37220 [Parasphingorhabdus pacifica]